MTRYMTLLFLLGVSLICSAQDQKPAYCDELPSTYGNVVAPPGGRTAPILPRFATTAINEYKVQVAILRQTDPKDFPFHPSLVARYRPCEQVWVVESRESFPTRAQAESLQKNLIGLGYQGAYITDLVAYQ